MCRRIMHVCEQSYHRCSHVLGAVHGPDAEHYHVPLSVKSFYDIDLAGDRDRYSEV